MKKKFAFKSLLSLAMAGLVSLSSVNTLNANAAGSEEIVSYERSELTDDGDYKNVITIEDLSNDYNNDLSGKTIILSTNDSHGAIQDFAHIAALKNYIKNDLKAAEVILVDSGDFGEDKDSKYFNNKEEFPADYKKEGNIDDSHGLEALKIMNAAGYDYITWGNHEFSNQKKDFDKLVEEAGNKLINSNIFDSEGNFAFTPHVIRTVGEGENALRIGFFGLDTKEAAGYTAGKKYTFLTDNKMIECAKKEVEYLRGIGEEPTGLKSDDDKSSTAKKLEKPADIVICLSHLGLEDKYAPSEGPNKIGIDGTRSADVWERVKIADPNNNGETIHGIDLMLDGHSHTAINDVNQKDKAPIMSCKIWCEYIGITIIDNSKKEIEKSYLIPDDKYEDFKAGEDSVEDFLEKYGATETLNAIDAAVDKKSNSENPGKSGRGNDGKYTGRNSGKNNGKNNGKNSNSRFGKRGFEYDEEDTEYEETAEPVEDASVVASTSDESTEFTSEASSDNSSELNEQSTEAASTEETAETSEQDNAEQSEDTEVEPAA